MLFRSLNASFSLQPSLCPFFIESSPPRHSIPNKRFLSLAEVVLPFLLHPAAFPTRSSRATYCHTAPKSIPAATLLSAAHTPCTGREVFCQAFGDDCVRRHSRSTSEGTFKCLWMYERRVPDPNTKTIPPQLFPQTLAYRPNQFRSVNRLESGLNPGIRRDRKSVV